MEVPSAVKKSTTSNSPFVIVPVLSLNKIFREPAVSIPSALRTNTLWSNILLVFCIKTSEIIKGSPSGTAQTIITTASETALIKSSTTFATPIAKYAWIPPAIKIKYPKYNAAITIAPIYPNLEIWSASLESLTFNGESGSSSCISSAIFPIIVWSPTLWTSITPSPSKITAPRNKEYESTNVSPVISSAR